MSLSRGHAAGALAALMAVLSAACGPPLMKLPSGPGQTAPDFDAAFLQATSACNPIGTLTAEIGASGSVGARRVRSRLIGGFAPGSARLEAVAPFGQPLFVFAAAANDATLLLPRDNRVLQHGRPDEVLEAIAGIRLGPTPLLRTLTGCAVPERMGNPLAIGDNWRTVAGDGGSKAYLHRESPSAPWHVAAVLHPGQGLRWSLRVDYSDFDRGLPHTIRLVSGEADRFDLRLTLSQVDINIPLGPEVFRVQIPSSAVPISLEELRAAGPLASTGSQRREPMK